MLSYKLAKNIGIINSVILSELISWQYNLTFVSDKDRNSFCCNLNHFEDKWGINKRTCSRHLKELESMNLISIERKGMPCKNYFTLNEENILNKEI